MLDNIIREAARRFGDAPALVGPDDATVTYAELDATSDALGAWLRDHHGISEGDVVALAHPSDATYVALYLAIAKLGAVTAGINPKLTATERSAILERTRPTLVVGTAALLDALVTDAPCVEPATTREPAHPPAALDDDPERIVAIVFTSGTTGTPKGAVFRNRQLAAIGRIDLGDDWASRWGGGGPMLVSTQFPHIGFMTKLAWYLQLGTTLHYVERWRSATILERIAAARISVLGAVAPQLALLVRSPRLAELDVSCVDTIIAGGAASPPGLVHAARDAFGADYSIRYSSTESGGVGLATEFDAVSDDDLASVGRPRPGVEIRIVDPAGVPVADGDTGELCLRSEAMFDHYWNDPEATATTLVDGWLRTGDLARVDDAGRVRLAGRRSDMYVRGGYNVHPVEVEAVLSRHPGISQVAVAGAADDVMGEIGVAVAVAHDALPGGELTLEELRDWAADRLAPWKLPERLVIVDELPLTAMQKIDRAAVGTIARMERPT